MINEILARKEIKRLIKHGIPKIEAKRIVDEVMTIVGDSSENTLHNAIDYAISLTYRINISEIVK